MNTTMSVQWVPDNGSEYSIPVTKEAWERWLVLDAEMRRQVEDITGLHGALVVLP